MPLPCVSRSEVMSSQTEAIASVGAPLVDALPVDHPGWGTPTRAGTRPAPTTGLGSGPPILGCANKGRHKTCPYDCALLSSMSALGTHVIPQLDTYGARHVLPLRERTWSHR